MSATLTNLLVYELIALVLISMGAGIVRGTRGSRPRAKVPLRLFAWLSSGFGLAMIGYLLLNYPGGRPGEYRDLTQSGPFYLAGLLLAGTTLVWLFGFRPALKPLSGLAQWLCFPLLAVGLVFGVHLFASASKSSSSASLREGMNAAQGQAAPEIMYFDIAGQRRALSELRGKVVLLNFWHTQCAPCIQEMPDLSKIQSKLEPRGFALVYLSAEAQDVLAEFFKKHSLVGIQGRIAPELPVPPLYQSGKAYPVTFLIGRDGVIAATWLGAAPPSWIEGRIEPLL